MKDQAPRIAFARNELIPLLNNLIQKLGELQGTIPMEHNVARNHLRQSLDGLLLISIDYGLPIDYLDDTPTKK